MGKKRVIQKKGRTKGGKKLITPKAAKGKLPKVEKGRVYIKATYNNTIVSITDQKGNLIASSSAGRLGFRGPKKATPYAATQVVESLSEVIDRIGLKEVDVYVRGIGSGRESATRALPSQGLTLTALRDTTPIPHNGVRAKKPRRV